MLRYSLKKQWGYSYLVCKILRVQGLAWTVLYLSDFPLFPIEFTIGVCEFRTDAERPWAHWFQTYLFHDSQKSVI